MAKVIVIEDEHVLRALIADELEDAGHHVIEASDGAEGLASIKLEHPDVIVSDIGMPRMDGYELWKSLQNCPAFKETPFFFVSSHPIEDAIRAGVSVKDDDYLRKPVKFDVLMARIDACKL
ncbi:MAG: response regulator [Pseudomonadota bacterium]